ncbi:tRNA (adenosine(37)-N6)-threonylcarbamoyltransferase complex dimerization subunit type 1 TsaB [Paenibacillus allorhizosphaerae]|uniref:tRNA threonylcarbamoyladenosine biosynthesis protein TsaB n=1 Tax=Paenibacillus allorhizosphaerae TaxID=2849866 RepID=A0ABM8VPV5_9BACL|nr:tRNA (adenosine(37)-N6)-threonylcarbamoyltransferase complex dimerization subunit type 1 TsaB [Paenibacillus allorhizosphaerae]CAG7653408.1 tRNA threonylcarbamoyladenosine biosynthesis protein TsaB [Paenibacillus allorhizosphaerae]
MTNGIEAQYDDQKWMLSVDTSTTSMTAALTLGDKLVGEISSKAERNHSLYLIPTLQRLMNEAGVRPKELAAFAVGVGPGSYTGVRIGVTVAKTFAWTHKLALMGVSTLEAIALGGADILTGQGDQGLASEDTVIAQGGKLRALDGVSGQNSALQESVWVIPLIDARRGQAFTALYEACQAGWTCMAADGIRLSSEWVKELLDRTAESAPDRVVFAGEPELHREAIELFAEGWKGPVDVFEQGLRARYTAELGRRRWLRGETDDVFGLVPNYTQLAEAEAKLLANKS